MAPTTNRYSSVPLHRRHGSLGCASRLFSLPLLASLPNESSQESEQDEGCEGACNSKLGRSVGVGVGVGTHSCPRSRSDTLMSPLLECNCAWQRLATLPARARVCGGP